MSIQDTLLISNPSYDSDSDEIVNSGRCSSQYETNLHIAAGEGDLLRVMQLVHQGYDVNVEQGYCSTPLHYASDPSSYSTHKLHSKVAGFLAMNGADLEAKNKEEYTPLHIAVLSGQKDTVKVLIDYGANVNSINKWGKSPLDTAQDSIFIIPQEIKTLLVEHGAKSGDTLRNHCMDESTDVCRPLMEESIVINDILCKFNLGWDC